MFDNPICIKTRKHRFRDNKFGITWCTRCGLLANKPCGIDLNSKEINQ